MARKTRISSKLIDQICELIRQRIKTRDLCEVVGINYGTYHSWLNRGRKESEGHYHDLVVKIAESEDEVYDDLKQVVFNAALKGSKEYQRVTKTIRDVKGEIRTEETETEKDLAPDAKLALVLMERKYPDKWGATQRVQVDWKNLAVTQGIDPQTLQEEFRQMFLVNESALTEKELKAIAETTEITDNGTDIEDNNRTG